MSRVKKTLTNAKVGVLFYFISTVVSFITRRIFLQYLGDDFIGLTGTLKSILGFLNLAELGIGTAIGFTLFKPLFDNNTHEIRRLVSLIGFLYRRLAIFLLTTGIILSLFFPLIFDNEVIPNYIIYIGFYAYLLAAVLGYFINYSQVVLSADQKGYVITAYSQVFIIVRQIIQAIIAFWLQSMVLWLAMELVFSFMNSYLLDQKVKKIFPYLQNKIPYRGNILNEYSNEISKIKQVFVHKLSSFVTSGTDQILIYAIIDLKSVAFFGNYFLVFNQLKVLINNLFSGMASGVGNLIAENNISQIHKVFWEMMGIRFLIGGYIVINLIYVVDPFISLWLGDEYVLSNLIVYLMIFNLGMNLIRIPIDNYITAYGLYQDTWAPIAQMFINLFVSIFFGIKMGIAGIMLGTSISMFLIVLIWKPFFLFSRGFQMNVVLHYWPKFLLLVLSSFLSFIVINLVVNEYLVLASNTFVDFIFYVGKLNLIILATLPAFLFLFNKGVRDFFKRLLRILS